MNSAILEASRGRTMSKTHHDLNSDAWLDLAQEFTFCVNQEPRSKADWCGLWRLLVEAPCVLREIQQRAAWQVRSMGLPADWAGDIAQDVTLILARQLRSSGDLHVDRGRLPHGFAPWLRTIIRRACLEAIRTPRRQQQRLVRMPDEDVFPARDDAAAQELRIDVRLAIEQLAEPRRTILLLYDKGLTLSDIASRLALPTSSVHREVKRGIADLRERLAA